MPCSSPASLRRSFSAVRSRLRPHKPPRVPTADRRVLQKDSTVDEPKPEHLHQIGTVAEILRYVTAPDGTHHIVSRGTRRFRVLEYLPGYPFLVAEVDEIGEAEVYSTEVAARMHQLRERAREAISLLPNVPTEIGNVIEQTKSPSTLADFIANVSDLTPTEKQDILETLDVSERLDKVLRYLAQQIEVLKLSKQIGEQTQESLRRPPARAHSARAASPNSEGTWRGRGRQSRDYRASRGDRQGRHVRGG